MSDMFGFGFLFVCCFYFCEFVFVGVRGMGRVGFLEIGIVGYVLLGNIYFNFLE